MDDEQINRRFLELLKKWVDAQENGWGSKGKAAKKLGLTQGHLKNVLDGVRKLSEKRRLDIIKRLNMPYDDIYGINLCSVSDTQPSYCPPSSTVIELKHIDVIKNFQNKTLATTINERLVELEKINPAALDQILGYIDCKISEELSAANSGDRRKRQLPEKIPITGDRRKLVG